MIKLMNVSVDTLDIHNVEVRMQSVQLSVFIAFMTVWVAVMVIESFCRACSPVRHTGDYRMSLLRHEWQRRESDDEHV